MVEKVLRSPGCDDNESDTTLYPVNAYHRSGLLEDDERIVFK